MDPRLTIAVANASLSVAEELFADEDKWRGSWKEAMSIVGFLQAASASYKDVLSDEALEEGLRRKAEENLQKARKMLSQIREFILSKKDPEGD